MVQIEVKQSHEVVDQKTQQVEVPTDHSSVFPTEGLPVHCELSQSQEEVEHSQAVVLEVRTGHHSAVFRKPEFEEEVDFHCFVGTDLVKKHHLTQLVKLSQRCGKLGKA